MKVIFLDVDGVLNHIRCNELCGICIGILDSKVKLLKQIVDETGALIVLSSTWRYHWTRPDEMQLEDSEYLNNKFQNQDLFIFDKTKDYVKGADRGGEIKEWLSRNKVSKWIVIDDEIFADFECLGIIEHLIKTDFYKSGLEQSHVDIAIKLLND